ncbi:hypothetical protein SteCoe_21459 [Stentor coeruleus]|uniref:Uncharacterized protein n=1 Tax=Stentor coeruleus TaxID=5963 RepID=A0A1R2BPG0_9CILI|nr:hypothetical protein SteCoe_21459 [Stentor coeruleus]
MEVQKIFEDTFHLKKYVISLNVTLGTLQMTIFEEGSATMWKGSFTQSYIEDLTSKTGNFKQYKVFCKMLLSGLEKTSQSVIIDVLTQEEFENIRSEPKPGRNLKLYMIMTYIVEFDKVHYPLSLSLANKKKFSSSQDLKVLQDELSELRLVKQEKDIMEKRLETMISDRDKEIYYLSKEKEELQTELDKIKNQMDSIIEQLESQAKINTNKSVKINEELKLQNEKLENEVEKMKKEAKSLRDEQKKDKSRILQLESELKGFFDKSKSNRPKSITASASQLQRSVAYEPNELNNRLSRLRSLLEISK